MRTANTHRNMARCAATATLACVLGLGLAAPAYADTASDLAAARTKLEQIGTQTQQIYDELATQTQALDQTAGEITQKQQEIADGQAKLSTYVAGEYKTGGLSLLQVLTGVDDLSDMLNRLFYYGKVSDKQAQTIQEVKELKQQLTDKQAEQEKNVAATQKKVDELNAQQAEAQNVVNSLDSQLQAELAAEAEANAPKLPEKKAEPEKKPEKKEKEKPALPEGCVSADDFFKCQLRVAKVISCEHVKKSEKLLKFDLDLGGEHRTILSGIAKFYEPEQLIGKNLVIIANLPPRKMMGIESNGMILSAVEEKEDGSEYLRVLTVDGDVAPGSEVG